MGYATADVGEGRRARAPAGFRSSIAYVPRRSSEPASPVRPRLSTRRSFPSRFQMAESASRFYPDPAPLGRYSGGRRAAGPAAGPRGAGARPRSCVDRHRTVDIIDKPRIHGLATPRLPIISNRCPPNKGGMKIVKSEVSDVYKTKMGSSTVHAEESRYRRHPECLPLGTRTANMEQHKHAERSEPELPPGALALAPRPPI